MTLAFWVARESSTESFGAWSIGYALFMVALQITRAIAATPLLLEPEELRESWHAAGATGLSIAIGLIFAGAMSAGSFYFSELRSQFLTFAFVMPFVLAQDVLRHVAFTRDKAWAAALFDGTWLAIQVGISIVAVTSLQSVPPSVSLTLAWGASAIVSIGIALLILRPSQGLFRASEYHRRTAHLSKALAGDATLGALGSQSLPAVVAAVAGLSSTGALRGGLTLMGPLNIVITGLTPIATLEARKRASGEAGARRFLLLWTSGLGVIGAIYGLVLLLLPDTIGRAALGPTWLPAQALLLPLILEGLTRGPWSGVPVILRARLQVHAALRLKFITTACLLIFPTAGALAAGAQGAAWGVLVSSCASSAASLLALRRSGHRV